MAQYMIRDNQTGKTVTVSGDTPPSESDAEGIFQQAGLRNNQSPQQSQQEQAPQQEHPVMNLLRHLGLGIIPDVLGTTEFALNEAKQGINPFNADGATPDQLQQASQGNHFLSQQELGQTGGVKQAGQDLAGASSYLVPFGKGATLASKVLVPGAVSGGMQAVSQPDATAGSVVSGVAGGTAGAGLMHGLGALLSLAGGKTGGTLSTIGNRVLQSQYKVGAGQKIANRLADTVKTLADYGLTNIDNIANASQHVTGHDGIVNQMKNEAIANANPVDTGGLLKFVDEQLSNQPLIANSTTAKNFKKIIVNGIRSTAGADTKTVANDMAKAGNPVDFTPTTVSGSKLKRDMRFKVGNENAYKSVPGGTKGAGYDGPLFSGATVGKGKSSDIVGADPTKIFSFIKDLEGQASDLMYGNATKTEQQLARVYKNVANELKTRLFQGAGADNQIVKLSPEQYAQLHEISPKLAKDVASAKTVRELRAIEAPFVRAGKLAGITADQAGTNPIDIGDEIGGILSYSHPQTLALVAGRKALNSNMGRSMIGGAMHKAGSRVVNPINPQLQKLLDIAGARVGSAVSSQ